MANSPLQPVQPLDPPRKNILVEPQNVFRLGDQELLLFDGYAQELNQIAGIPCEWWGIDIPGSKRDPLYDEPTEIKWKGPFSIVAWVEQVPSAPEVMEEGVRFLFEASMWVARKEFEDASSKFIPGEGDLVRFYKMPFYDRSWSTQTEEDVPGAGFFFDVTEVENDGHVLDNASFTGYKISIRRRTEFTPERRLTPP